MTEPDCPQDVRTIPASKAMVLTGILHGSQWATFFTGTALCKAHGPGICPSVDRPELTLPRRIDPCGIPAGWEDLKSHSGFEQPGTIWCLDP